MRPSPCSRSWSFLASSDCLVAASIEVAALAGGAAGCAIAACVSVAASAKAESNETRVFFMIVLTYRMAGVNSIEIGVVERLCSSRLFDADDLDAGGGGAVAHVTNRARICLDEGDDLRVGSLLRRGDVAAGEDLLLPIAVDGGNALTVHGRCEAVAYGRLLRLIDRRGRSAVAPLDHLLEEEGIQIRFGDLRGTV